MEIETEVHTNGNRSDVLLEASVPQVLVYPTSHTCFKDRVVTPGNGCVASYSVKQQSGPLPRGSGEQTPD